jgi:hypothetical protein
MKRLNHLKNKPFNENNATRIFQEKLNEKVKPPKNKPFNENNATRIFQEKLNEKVKPPKAKYKNMKKENVISSIKKKIPLRKIKTILPLIIGTYLVMSIQGAGAEGKEEAKEMAAKLIKDSTFMKKLLQNIWINAQSYAIAVALGRNRDRAINDIAIGTTAIGAYKIIKISSKWVQKIVFKLLNIKNKNDDKFLNALNTFNTNNEFFNAENSFNTNNKKNGSNSKKTTNNEKKNGSNAKKLTNDKKKTNNTNKKNGSNTKKLPNSPIGKGVKPPTTLALPSGKRNQLLLPGSTQTPATAPQGSGLLAGLAASKLLGRGKKSSSVPKALSNNKNKQIQLANAKGNLKKSSISTVNQPSTKNMKVNFKFPGMTNKVSNTSVMQTAILMTTMTNQFKKLMEAGSSKNSVFRKLSKQYHPNKPTGSKESMQILQNVRDSVKPNVVSKKLGEAMTPKKFLPKTNNKSPDVISKALGEAMAPKKQNKNLTKVLNKAPKSKGYTDKKAAVGVGLAATVGKAAKTFKNSSKNKKTLTRTQTLEQAGAAGKKQVKARKGLLSEVHLKYYKNQVKKNNPGAKGRQLTKLLDELIWQKIQNKSINDNAKNPNIAGKFAGR